MALNKPALASLPKTRRVIWGAIYVAFVVIVAGLFEASLNLVRVRGGFTYPPAFQFFRALFYVQFGLFGGALLSGLLCLLPRWRLPLAARALFLGIFYLGAAWLFIWGLIQRGYGIELTLGTVFELFTNPVATAAMGLERREFGLIVGISLAIVALFTAVSLQLASRCERNLRLRVFLVFTGLFLLVHVPVRAYFVYNINRDQHVVLVYDDCAPLSLQSEWLVPGLRRARIALPNFESESRAKKYREFLRVMEIPTIPRPRNILWISIESLRFDAINEAAMPRLHAYRDRFQVRLDRNHWSSGNATQFGNFSMLAGLSGYHFRDLLRAKISDPFFVLLARNGYRLRVGSREYYQFGRLFALFPPETLLIDVAAKSIPERDRRMVDLYLEDRGARPAGLPGFDLLPFDSTHWPYRFPRDHAIFHPAALVGSSTHILRSGSDLVSIRNRYRNSCHFLDEQIGRVLDDLQARGAFEDTIVVLAGDHGEEFQERGQITHSAVLNDYQGRTVLWMHFPDLGPEVVPIDTPTVHMDIVPTLLEALGFSEDKLYTQGRSLLGKIDDRPALSLCEQGFTVPLYRAVVTDTYISRWWRTPRRYLFSGVQRRDGASVEGEEWLSEVRTVYPRAAEMYEILPDVSQPPRRFDSPQASPSGDR